MANPIYGEASAERIAETNAMLATLEAATTYTDYMLAYVAAEQRANSEDLMGRFEERDRIWARVKAAQAAIRPLLRAEYNAIRVYSSEEIRAFNQPATLDDVTALVCGRILSTAGVDAVSPKRSAA